MGSRERFLTIGQKKKKNGKTSFLALHTAVCLETKLHIPIFVLLLLVALIDFYANVINLNTSLTSRSDSSSSKKSEEKKKNKKNPRAKTRTKKKKHAHTDAHTAHHPRSLNVIPRKTHKTPVGLAGPACMLPRPIINDGLFTLTYGRRLPSTASPENTGSFTPELSQYMYISRCTKLAAEARTNGI